MDCFNIIHPASERVPLLISVPHCGTTFPDELEHEYARELISRPDDTDWFVDRLYDFAPAMGATMITAMYSRWVIDLNRSPDDKPLYTDGRIITGLCPVTDFKGRHLYNDERSSVDDREIARRKALYYDPYHRKLTDTLRELKSEFGKVLLWDCHSIRQYVKTIYADKFPDLILGDADGAAASPDIIATAYYGLQQSAYTLSHNFPFKGGYITRAYGRPLENEHALQLEMAKVNYMDDEELTYDTQRAEKMRGVLQSSLLSLIRKLQGD
jgi:N-formylglutamate amidohydrolase